MGEGMLYLIWHLVPALELHQTPKLKKKNI